MRGLLRPPRGGVVMRRGTVKMGGGVSMKTPLSNRRQAALPLIWQAGFTSNGNSKANHEREQAALAIRTDKRTFTYVKWEN